MGRLEQFELLLEAGRLLSSKLEIAELLTTVMGLSAKVVHAETASLLLVDPVSDELYFHVALGLPAELSDLRLKMGEGICGVVAETARPLIINDVRNDPRWSSKVDDSSGFITRSILAVPILVKERCIGVVEAINHIDGDFTEDDHRTLESFASQAGVAIENARLFASLQQERAKLSTVFNEMSDAALLSDRTGEVLMANNAARRFIGQDSLGARVEDFLGGGQTDPPLETLLSSDRKMHGFEALREEPQRLVLAGTSSAVRDSRDGAVTGRVLVFRDVTEARREEGLKRNFLALISHKLKTPLSSITGYSQLLLDALKKKGFEGFELNALAAVQTQGQKLSLLLDKLINFTVMEQLDGETIKRVPFGLRAALEEAVSALEPYLQETGARVEQEDGPEVQAFGDPSLVRDLARSLIENAVKFSGLKDAVVRVGVEKKGALVRLRVKDSGPGIAPEERDKIFEKFYQIDRSFTGQVEGWGLGLTFVRRVAAELGGEVRVESKPGEGSVFIVSLPAAEDGDA